MASLDLEELTAAWGVDWRERPRSDRHEHFAELDGPVVALPSPDAIESGVRSLGLEVHRRTRRPVAAQASVVEIFGRREREELHVVCVPHVPAPYAAPATLRITWKSGERPAIDGKTYAWNGRAWPILLDDARLHHRSSRMLVIEGHARRDDVARIAAWAAENGMRQEAPYEPDLGGAFRARDATHEVTLTPRGERTTLTIARLEDR